MAMGTAPPAAAPCSATSPVPGETQLRRLIAFTNKVKARFRTEEHVFIAFYETISLAEEMGVYWVYRKLRCLFNDHQDLIVEFSEFLPVPSQAPKRRRTWMAGSMKIGGAGDAVRCTPSYLYSASSSEKSRKSSEEGNVLNDTLVCMPQKRDPSFRGGTIKNEHAEILALSEEEMYEADMLVETVKSAIARIWKLLYKVLPNSDRGAVVHVENHLTPGDLRCIEKIYGPVGQEMVECVRKNPSCALPRVLTRLEHKEKEWRMLRSEVSKGLKESLARHHGPSLGRGLCTVSGKAPTLPLPLPPPPPPPQAQERPNGTIESAPVERLAGLRLNLNISLDVTATEKPFLFGQSLRCLLSRS